MKMSSLGKFEDPTHLDALRAAWWEFKEAVAYRVDELTDDYGDGRRLPLLHAWLCAPWGPLAYRFTPYNLERIFQPQKADRRQRLSDLREYVGVCGADEWDEARWQEAEALAVEFGGGFPPRDYEPPSVAEMVGGMMGYSREEVAAIVSRSPLPA